MTTSTLELLYFVLPLVADEAYPGTEQSPTSWTSVKSCCRGGTARRVLLFLYISFVFLFGMYASRINELSASRAISGGLFPCINVDVEGFQTVL